MSTTPTGPTDLLHRIGFPADLTLGFLAIVVFVIGDGIEAVWIIDYLHHDIGYSVG